MPADGDLLPALFMLVVVIVTLAAVFLFLMKRTAGHAAPYLESGMTDEPLPDISFSPNDRPHDSHTVDRSGFSGDGGSGGGAGASDKW